MGYKIHQEGEFQYIEEGKGENLVLLHGLFGALSNWQSVIDHFKDRYRVIIPLLPIYTMPVKKAGLEGLVKFFTEFVETRQLEDMILMGNSLGGHVALIYTLENPLKVKTLILTGSSGLFENSMGGSYPKRGSYEYVKERVEYTFYEPSTISEDYIQEVFETTRSIPKCLRIVSIAKSAQRHNLAKELPDIKAPTLLIWGLNDTITPPMVAHDFNRLIPNSTLRFIDHCCHAPMMEQPDKFNIVLDDFLSGQKIEA
ncbi:MAG TPA: alpha/beta hydrolase [Cytophagales bacterium]|jgi:pimeloyl-ACP methyl ester carboxylesterase|nr:alpha/beta hydrolase [Cytophagales bacterium]